MTGRNKYRNTQKKKKDFYEFDYSYEKKEITVQSGSVSIEPYSYQSGSYPHRNKG